MAVASSRRPSSRKKSSKSLPTCLRLAFFLAIAISILSLNQLQPLLRGVQVVFRNLLRLLHETMQQDRYAVVVDSKHDARNPAREIRSDFPEVVHELSHQRHPQRPAKLNSANIVANC